MAKLTEIIEYLLQNGHATEASFHAGDLILKEGEQAEEYYFVLDGSCEVFTMIDGDEKILDLIKAGEFFGEAGLFEGHTRSANVRAKTDVRAAKITRDVFNNANLDLQNFLLAMLNNVSIRLANTNRLFVAMIEVGNILAQKKTETETAQEILTLLKEKLQAKTATFVQIVSNAATILAGDQCEPAHYIDELGDKKIRELKGSVVIALKNQSGTSHGCIILQDYATTIDATVRNVLTAIADQIAASFQNKAFEAAEQNKERLQQKRF